MFREFKRESQNGKSSGPSMPLKSRTSMSRKAIVIANAKGSPKCGAGIPMGVPSDV